MENLQLYYHCLLFKNYISNFSWLVKIARYYGTVIKVYNSTEDNMRREKPLRIIMRIQELENINKFRYLNSIVIKDAYYTSGIRSRTSMSRNTFKKQSSFLTSDLSMKLKKKLIKYYIWRTPLDWSEVSTPQNV